MKRMASMGTVQFVDVPPENPNVSVLVVPAKLRNVKRPTGLPRVNWNEFAFEHHHIGIVDPKKMKSSLISPFDPRSQLINV
jgi:hypothetical protein